MIFWPDPQTRLDLEVAYFAEFPRGPDGTCAFCRGDPCAENPPAHTMSKLGDPPGYRIASYYERNPDAVTCPMCEGRPT
jgi:hypothetical protein